MGVRLAKLEKQKYGEDGSGTVIRYMVSEAGREFTIDCRYHPHHGTSLVLVGKEGTLHINDDEDGVIRQIVAPGGGCALAIREEVVEGLSPVSLRALILAQSNDR